MKTFAFIVDEYAAVKLNPSEDIADKKDILPKKVRVKYLSWFSSC